MPFQRDTNNNAQVALDSGYSTKYQSETVIDWKVKTEKFPKHKNLVKKPSPLDNNVHE